MNWLRKTFGRRPVDIAFRELRKAERQLFDVETDLEQAIAARDYLQRRIDRLELFVKLDGLDRTEFSGSAERMATRISRDANTDFQTPYSDPFAMAVKAVGNFSKIFVKQGNKNAI